MKKLKQILVIASVFALVTSSSHAQCGGSYDTDGDETPNSQFSPGCVVYNACNGSRYAGNTGTGGMPCYNYDPDYSDTGGCDLNCAPIDAGVLFLLFGGAAFGGLMIMRRRETDLSLIPSKE
jgi:hypothetical protein